MAQIICYEVFPTDKNIRKMRSVLVKRHDFIEKQNQYGSYFYAEVSSLDSWQIKTMLDIRGYKYKSFDKRYSRSTSYRQKFFENNTGPYHCVYCGRRLKGKNMEIDHLIPVSKAKTSFAVRTCLQICGIGNVNDVKNLVASCSKCNRKKSDKMGLWVIRGAIGRFKLFWTIRNILVIILVVLALCVLFSVLPLTNICMNLLLN